MSYKELILCNVSSRKKEYYTITLGALLDGFEIDESKVKVDPTKLGFPLTRRIFICPAVDDYEDQLFEEMMDIEFELLSMLEVLEYIMD
jgi:hypothetical protein